MCVCCGYCREQWLCVVGTVGNSVFALGTVGDRGCDLCVL